MLVVGEGIMLAGTRYKQMGESAGELYHHTVTLICSASLILPQLCS